MDLTRLTTDAELFDAARSRDSRAVDELWRRHHPYARSMARRYTSSTGDAEDLASEAFCKILALLRDGRGPLDHARTYIARTVRNLATDASRKRTVHLVSIEAAYDVSSPDDPARATLAALELTEAFEVLRQCSARQRLALWRTACEGVDLQEVADELGISRNAVAALLVRAREQIRRRLAATAEATTGRSPHRAAA